jgi:hypothetical protein
MSLLRVTTASDFSNTQSRFGRSISGQLGADNFLQLRLLI